MAAVLCQVLRHRLDQLGSHGSGVFFSDLLLYNPPTSVAARKSRQTPYKLSALTSQLESTGLRLTTLFRARSRN